MYLRLIPALAAWTILIAATAAFFMYPCGYLKNTKFEFVYITQGIVFVFTVANFLLAQFTDPGTLQRADPDEYRDEDPNKAPYIKTVRIQDTTVRIKWCTTCQFYRPPRCSHCSVCGNCIDVFDHHCPWINNCVGRGNYRHFFLFLLSLSIHMLTIFAWCIVYLINHREELKQTSSIVAIVLVTLIFFLIWPIVGLTIFHILLICKNRTTNEQMTGKFRTGENPFNHGCCTNCASILCGPHLPKLKTTSINPLMVSTGDPKNGDLV